MTRRAIAHNYSAPGAYHITLHVADGLGQPFGTVVGNLTDYKLIEDSRMRFIVLKNTKINEFLNNIKYNVLQYVVVLHKYLV